MADKHSLPRYPAAATVWFQGANWNKIADLLERWRPRAGANMLADVTATGTILSSIPPLSLGRFEPFIGGGHRDRLYVAPGAAAYVEEATEDHDAALFVVPEIPTIDGTPLDANEAPSFDIGDKNDGALWLIVQRRMCGSSSDSGDGQPRIEFTERHDKPEVADGELAVMLAEFDLITTDNGGKRFDGMIARWQSDWPQIYEPCESSSSSSSSGSSSSSSSGSSESSGSSQGGSSQGSSKDNAIVPAAWSKTGFVALYTIEAPDVRFEEVMEFPLTGYLTRQKIDRRYVSVCEEGTLRACGITIDWPVAVGVAVEGEWIIVRVRESNAPMRVVVKLTGIRRGFLGTRFGLKTREQFEANERRLQGN